MTDRLTGVRHAFAGAVELGAHRLEGQGHVRARVAVGHGVDVEAVDRVLMGPEDVAIAAHDGTQFGGTEAFEHGHDRRMLPARYCASRITPSLVRRATCSVRNGSRSCSVAYRRAAKPAFGGPSKPL